MLAKIRFHDKGIGHTLPKLIDLAKFSEEAIRERMAALNDKYYYLGLAGSTFYVIR
ncbi:TPA: hypothetical protein U1D13_000625 [Streptococcus suis]|uniref:hypothetical protein n=1 Tax=Streptococcus suis TaxID=1307 RepID=UPI00241011C6|nr:hypothetical protein [Streptococcus suis]MDG3136923.1 hypothetical protein [Streptococcus suis]HEM3630746.1 hypothetical protein [Streptococcus suis]HEM3657628.1 hypothetical protein [Streptococcus suis]HEM3699843.1 hypothetical protein [Streptococcus suis]HEM3714609.1 hypothetical protein [Streptococcus suis]